MLGCPLDTSATGPVDLNVLDALDARPAHGLAPTERVAERPGPDSFCNPFDADSPFVLESSGQAGASPRKGSMDLISLEPPDLIDMGTAAA